MPLFEIRGLEKRFGEERVLDGVDLDVFRGERITIIGESGSGKSVLLKHIVGLFHPDAGSIVFDGKSLNDLDEPGWVEVRRRVGMLFQESALFDSMSVLDNVAYALREQRLMPEEAIKQRVLESLVQVSLPGIEAMWPAALSGGMRKRVALARAIALRPEVVLYDEPTEGLDPVNVTRVDRLLDSLRTNLGITTVVVTHNMRSAFSASDRIALMHRGRVVVVGPPDELARSNEPTLQPFLAASKLEVGRPSAPPPEPRP